MRETHGLLCTEGDPHCPHDDGPHPCHYVEYRADTDAIRPGGWPKDDAEGPRWRPSIHMPRWASRISLEVTEIRVERLQEITERDALAEGIDPGTSICDFAATPARDDFARLWDSINGERAPWSSNPWVWCVSFRRVEEPSR